MLERRLQRPQRRRVRLAPGGVQLGIGTERGDGHPVEGEQREDDERRHRQVEVEPFLPLALDEHYALSMRLRKRSCTHTTANNTGNMNSDSAATSPSRPEPTPIWYA